MEKRNMNKILTSLLMIGVVAAMVGAGTWAYFSDVETSTGNTFTAGTLNLKVDSDPDNGQPVNAMITVGNLKPGDHGSKVIPLSNTGSLNGVLKLQFKDVVNTEGLNPEAETNTVEPGDLGYRLIVGIWYDMNGDGDYSDAGEHITVPPPSTINSVSDMILPLDGLNAGQTKNLKVDWCVLNDGASDNDFQGDIVTFNMEFTLTQA
jgi:spore coat-associated protein N